MNISEDSINKPDFNWLSNITLSVKELKNFEEKTDLNLDCFKEIPDHIKDRFMNIRNEEYELLNMENMLTIDIKNAVQNINHHRNKN